MARIALVGRSHWPALGGTQMHQHLLGQELAKKHKVTILAQHCVEGKRSVRDLTFGQRRFAPYQDGNTPVHCVGPNLLQRVALLPFLFDYARPGRVVIRLKPWAMPALQALFAAVYRRKLCTLLRQVDLVHVFNVDYLGAACITIANQLGIPCVATPHIHPGWWLDDESTMRMLNKCDYVFSALEFDRQFMIAHGIPPERCQAVGAPFDPDTQGDGERFRQRYGLKNDPVICFVGVKRWYKGIDVMLQAAPLVWEAFPQARFVLIGAPTPYSEQLFRSTGDPRILELGRVETQTKNDALAACDIFCLPSKSESFGIVFLEVWHFGKPVVAGETPATRELIPAAQGGMVVAHEPASLAKAIVTLLSNPEEGARMGQNGRKYARRYTSKEIGQRVERVYASLLSSQHPLGNGAAEGAPA